MISRLEIENFYSIRERQVIALCIGAKVPDEEGRFATISDGSGERVPKTVAFFGANASGKSNVLRAINFLSWFLEDSLKRSPDDPLPVSRFADGNTDPIRIEVGFDLDAAHGSMGERTVRQTTASRYIYELRLQGGEGERLSVLSEELREKPATGKSRRVFKRTASGEIQDSVDFPLKGLSQILSKLRPDASLTATLAQVAEHAATKVILNWARNISTNIFNVSDNPFERRTEIHEQELFKYYHEHPVLVDDINHVLGRVDLGIRSMSLTKTIIGPEPQFQHLGLTKPLLFLFESEGTRQFVRIYPYIWEALQYGGIAAIDEIDAKIHPTILPEVLRWFHEVKTNPHGAQLWITGQSASLLEDMRKEEIFFTEKDEQGRTKVYGLKDIEAVRRADNFYQKYLGGVYGAVPRIG